MANFTEAYKHTSAHEGGYANDPVDRGGETYRGISRVHHAAWPGWSEIDLAKGQADFPGSLKSNRGLQASVKSFYKQKYWDKFGGDQIPEQQIAMELYDTGVNMGVRRAVRFLQNSLNLLNRDQKNYKDLVVDGWFGDQSMTALSTHLQQDGNASVLLKLLNIQQGARYAAIMEAGPSQEKYARGWLKRA